MENLATEENDNYEILKKILNKKYKLVKKTRLNKYQLNFIKTYIELIKEIKSLENYFEQVKHLLSKNRISIKIDEIITEKNKRDNLFEKLIDCKVIFLT